MNLTFLGTAGMVPTKERNVQSIYLDYNGEGILLDCGEGTQRQMQLANLNFNKIKTILISHWHGDHVAGLVGLLQTIGAFNEEEKELTLYGPKDSQKYIDHILQSCVFDNHVNLKVVELDLKELTTFYENKEYALQAINLEHSTPCLGYRFVKKERRNISKGKLAKYHIKEGPHLAKLQQGEDITVDGKKILASEVTYMNKEKSVAFIFDTKLCDACFELADGCDVLVSEAVYGKKLEKKAIEYCHMTSYQAAEVANHAGCEKLYLTHFSQRYKSTEELESDAKEIFAETICAYDLLKVKLDF